MSSVCPQPTKEELDHLWQIYDLDKSGFLDQVSLTKAADPIMNMATGRVYQSADGRMS